MTSRCWFGHSDGAPKEHPDYPGLLVVQCSECFRISSGIQTGLPRPRQTQPRKALTDRLRLLTRGGPLNV